MKKYCLMGLCFMLMISIFPFSSVNAIEVVGEDAIQPSQYPKDAWVELFESSGISVPDDAVFENVEVIQTNGMVRMIPSMITTTGDMVSKSMILEYGIDENNELIPIDISMSMARMDDATPMDTYYKSYERVTIQAYYYKMYSTGGQLIYRPYKIWFISNVSKYVYIDYVIAGAKFNTSGQLTGSPDMFSLSVSANPAVVNKEYYASKVSPYYYNPVNGAVDLRHKIYVQVGNNTETFDVT